MHSEGIVDETGCKQPQRAFYVEKELSHGQQTRLLINLWHFDLWRVSIRPTSADDWLRQQLAPLIH